MRHLLLAMLISSNCFAAEYTFTFHVLSGRTDKMFKYKLESDSKWDALEIAGVRCGTFFGIGKRHIDEDELGDILTGCANPTIDVKR